MSANNLITTKNHKHGVTHAFAFSHRFIRISNMIEEKIKAKKKINYDDMAEIQMDTFDL